MRKFWTVFALLLLAPVVGSAETYRFSRFWPTLQQPWYFDFPNAVAVDSQDYVYVADEGNGRIVKLTAEGQFVASWEGSPDNGIFFQSPNGIAIDNTDQLYVSDEASYRVSVFDTGGRFLRQWWTEDEKGDGFRSTGIAADERGYVYLSDASNGTIRVYTQNGEPVGQWNGRENGGDPLQLPEGVAVDDRGNVFVTDIQADEVRAFSVNIVGKNLEAVPIGEGRWGQFGTEAGQFRDPAGIAVHQDTVFVVDIRNDRVQLFSYEGDYLDEFGKIGDQEGQFYAPTGIAVTPDGLVYVAGKNRRRIQKFRTDGRFLAAWQSMGTAPGKLQLPRGLAFDSTGNLYVADKNNDRIQEFSPEGVLLDSWGEFGDGPGQFNLPFDLAVRDTLLYVADTNNARIQVFDLTKEVPPTELPAPVDEGQTFSPHNLAFGPDGYLFVTDFDNHRFHRFDLETGEVDTWGEFGDGPGQMINPQGIAVHGDAVWISDLNDRIQKFDKNTGQYIPDWRIRGTAQGGLIEPGGLLIADEKLYVADGWKHRIQVFDLDGNFLDVIGKFGAGPGQFNAPTDLAFRDNRLYVTDSDNNRIQVFEQVETVANRKAILVAGGGPYEGNLLWDATRLNAGFAFRALAFQGFDSEDIRYFTADERSDLDFDGEPEQAIPPDRSGLRGAIQDVQWMKDAEQLVLYLVDHGGVDPAGNGVFRLGPSENLGGPELAGWLDAIQTDGKPEILLVTDFCAAGRFLEDFAGAADMEGVFLSSTFGDEEAYFLGQGAGSFSHGFWSGVLNGEDLQNAFFQGAEAVGGDPPLQNSVLDVDGDGADDSADNAQAGRGKFIGNAVSVSGGRIGEPTIVEVAESEEGVAVRVRVDEPELVSRVWVVVRPPSGVTGSDLFPPDTPILELPAFDLEPTGDSQDYVGLLTGLSESGGHTLLAFAADRDGNTSPPSPFSFDVGAPKVRKAVLVATGDPAGPQWPAVKNAFERAYGALRFQGYAVENIRAFAPQAILPVNTPEPSISNLRSALLDSIEAGLQDMVFFWVGEGDADGLAISSDETLTPEELDGWLDELQTRISGPVVVIGDSDGAGGWISDLVPPAGKERIVLTSASADGAALRSPDGAVSFSSLFWKEILAGRTVGRAFLSARNAAAFFGDGLETGPQWDDNGNGIAGERGEGNLALRKVIGAGIQLAANDPTAADVFEERINAEEGQPVTLRVSDVQSGSGTVSVAAVVASPDGTKTEIPMALDGGTGDYTGQFDAFTASGFYPVSYFAVNAEGAVSSLGEQTIFQPFGEDVFDFGDASDDSSGKATLLVVNDPSPDHHNFFEAEDPDWFMFFAIQGEAYEIRARASVVSGSGEPVFFSLFSEEAFTPLETRESAGDATELDWTWNCEATGIYQIKVQSFSSDAVGQNTGYTIQIVRPVGPFAGFLQGAVLDAATDTPLTNVRLRTSANASALTRPNGRFLMIQEPGQFELTIEADGYETLTQTVSISDLGTTEVAISIVPRSRPAEPPIEPPWATVSGIVKNSIDNFPIRNAQIKTSAGVTGVSRPNGRFIFFHPPGIFEIIIEASGFQTFRQNMQVNSLGQTQLEISLTPSITMNADFSAKPREGAIPLTVEFSDLSTTSADTPINREWDFGDGTTSSESDPVHVYEFPGVYTVRLRVFSNDGNSDTEIRQDWIRVRETAVQPGVPAANFEVNPTTGTPPFEIALSDRSTGQITERIWRVDGEVFAENISDPTYVLEECRDYEISLTVTGPGGRTDTISQTVNCGDETPTTGVVQGRIGGIPPGTGFTLEIAGEPVFVDGDGNFRVELPPGEYPLILVATDPISGTSQTWNESLSLAASETGTWDFTVSDWWTPPVFQPSAPEALLPNPEATEDSQGQVRLTAQFEPIREGQSVQSARWQIAESLDFAAIVMDITSEDDRTEIPVPMLVLKPDTAYHFRVRFADETGMDSEWSAPVSFTLPADSEDLDGNGVPDAQAAPDPATGNPSGTGFPWLYTASGNSRVGLEILQESGTVAAVRTLHPDEVPESPGRPDFLPLGLLAFRCEGLVPGASLSATVHFTREIPADIGWVLALPLADWQSWPADRAAFNPGRTAITLTLTDGGFGDLDGVANGVIVAPPSGPGSPPVESRVLFEGPSGDNVGGAGCFLQMIEVNSLR